MLCILFLPYLLLFHSIPYNFLYYHLNLILDILYLLTYLLTVDFPEPGYPESIIILFLFKSPILLIVFSIFLLLPFFNCFEIFSIIFKLFH